MRVIVFGKNLPCFKMYFTLQGPSRPAGTKSLAQVHNGVISVVSICGAHFGYQIFNH